MAIRDELIKSSIRYSLLDIEELIRLEAIDGYYMNDYVHRHGQYVDILKELGSTWDFRDNSIELRIAKAKEQ